MERINTDVCVFVVLSVFLSVCLSVCPDRQEIGEIGVTSGIKSQEEQDRFGRENVRNQQMLGTKFMVTS